MDQIAEILNTMRAENRDNSENFEKVLITINNKIDMMVDDNEATDLLKVYITELKNVVLEDYNNTVAKFEDIHASLNNLTVSNGSLAKTSELEGFRSNILENLNSLSVQVAAQKECVENLQAKIERDIDNIDFNRQESHSEIKDELSNILVNLKNIAEMNPVDSIVELSNLATLISENINLFNNEFKQAVENNLANSSKILDEVVSVSEKVSDVEDSLKESSQNNFEEIKDLLQNLELQIADDIKNTVLQEGIQRLEDEYLNIVTLQDFANFKTDLSDFLQKILDNANVLNINSDINKEQISNVLEKVNSLDYSSELENIADRINDFREVFDNNSKMNYDNIVNEINCLKDDLNVKLSNQDDDSIEKFSKLNTQLSDLSTNVQFLRDFSTQKSNDILDIVSSNLNLIADEVKESINNNARVNFDSLRELVSSSVSEIEQIKENLLQYNDSNVFNISAGFGDIKHSLENILPMFENLNTTFNDVAVRNYTNLSENLNEILSRVDELRLVITGLANDYNEKLFVAVKDLSEKLEDFSNNEEEFKAVSEFINTLSVQLQANKEESLEHIRSLEEAHTLGFKEVSQGLSNFEVRVFDILESLKEEFLNIDFTQSSQELQNKVNEKLLDLEAAVVNSSDAYNNKLLILQDKITEFAQIVENSAADTEGKIANSLEEIAEIKNQLVIVGESLKSSNSSSDEKSGEILCRLEAGIDSIVRNIETSNSSLLNGFNEVFKESVTSSEEKLTNIISVIESLKSDSNDDELFDFLEDKCQTLKDELRLVNTDITQAFQCRSEDVLRAFESVKTYLIQLSSIDFEKTISHLKEHFESVIADLNQNVLSLNNEDILAKIEQNYKEMFNKVSNIEDYVTDKIHDNIELLNAALQTCNTNIKDSFDLKITEGITDLKSYMETVMLGLLSTGETDALRIELLDRLDSLSEELVEKTDYSKEFASLENQLKNGFDSISQAVQTDYSFEFDSLESKLKDYIEEKSDNIVRKFDNEQAKNLIEALHAKVDILAEGLNDVNIDDEIDEIKDLIFEQRKFFEASSDEKTAAIDKYLRDVLLKLDNVDIEKNADDIKDTIINTLVSLVNEISFIEESEDIKDFVEEKTDEINQNLLEVQNRLKQIASANDDFDYTYTLQDVESDIARLRLAVNNFSDTDFEGFSDDIKKIATSIDALKSSLTQEQTLDVKNDIEKLQEDILSISSRTNKLLLTSDESYKALNDGLNSFSDIIYKLEDRINYLDNKEINERIERKIDNIHALSVETVNSDKIFHQVMTYLGEWIDSTTENISGISDKTSKIPAIEDSIDELRQQLPSKTELLDNLEERFKRQEERIDNLENKLEKILSTLEEKDDMLLNSKVDNIEKTLLTLSQNIAKLASYVDEE